MQMVHRRPYHGDPTVLRVCQPNTQSATPLKMRSQPTKMVSAIPAIGGTMIAEMPTTIIRTLIKIDHPRVFFITVVTGVAVALMTVPPKFHQESFETNAKQNAVILNRKMT